MIEFPKKVVVCYFGDKETVLNQSNLINKSSLPFELEERFKYETNPYLLQTFSQMINEAIDDTENEFMIFVNPKTIVSSEDIYFIIEKLCSGYCFVSIFGMAYCGFTKELVRNIGMFDEDFLAGEYEDNDFLLRIRLFGKAVYWGQNWSKYDFHQSSCPPNRGSSLTQFWRKWRWRNETIIDSKNKDKLRYISKRHSLPHTDISSSWKSYSESWGEGGIWNMVNGLTIKNSNLSEKKVNCNMFIRIRVSDNKFFIEMISTEDTAISFFLVSVYDRIPIHMQLVYSNTWYSLPFNGSAEMRLYHDGNIIYMNQIEDGFVYENNFRLPCCILD
jgi:hypothetical protein